MIFRGISRRFSTENDRQYEEIGAFWDEFATRYGRENIEGLGLNWEADSLEYVLGTTDNPAEFPAERFREIYADANYREVLLPDEGWQSFEGRTSELGMLYQRIYQDGPLTYEIESFTEDGRCRVRIFR